MSKSNDEKNDDDFWERGYEPSEKVKRHTENNMPNKISKTASVSFDGEQFYVRFPQDIANALNLSKEHKIKFTAFEYPEKENIVEIELVKPENDG